jgi:hypothetical protein
MAIGKRRTQNESLIALNLCHALEFQHYGHGILAQHRKPQPG